MLLIEKEIAEITKWLENCDVKIGELHIKIAKNEEGVEEHKKELARLKVERKKKLLK